MTSPTTCPTHGSHAPGHRPRAVAVGVVALSLVLAGCGDPQADAIDDARSAIEALPHIGAGAKADFTQELAGLDSETDLTAVVDRATAVNDLVGQSLGWVDGTTTQGRPHLTLEQDGTVAGDDRALLMMGSPTHWRPGQDTFDLCTSQDCAYWSAWEVQATVAGEYVFSLVGADQAVTRTFLPGQ